MIDITGKIYEKIKSIMDAWSEPDIYAISFFVYSNESYEYKDFSNVSSFAISYNTESDCEGADAYDEERWNYAFWRQDEQMIIDPDAPDELIDLLYAWYKENGIEDIGEEDDNCYDEDFNYIGKGPVGHYELLQIVSEVAKKLQTEGYIEAHFGKKLPIIIHGLEYAWYDIEATKKANPSGEADIFIAAMQDLGMIS
ncbi:MAG: hypothetical protein E7616_06090 [Ruminococcaceae bacterium]|nr:hypothetical protein [Oscillospiraceae bacterium]